MGSVAGLKINQQKSQILCLLYQGYISVLSYLLKVQAVPCEAIGLLVVNFCAIYTSSFIHNYYCLLACCKEEVSVPYEPISLVTLPIQIGSWLPFFYMLLFQVRIKHISQWVKNNSQLRDKHTHKYLKALKIGIERSRSGQHRYILQNFKGNKIYLKYKQIK